MALLVELARYCLRNPPALSSLSLSLSSFLAFIFFFLFVELGTHAYMGTERDQSLSRAVQRTRERGACAGLRGRRNCRYAAKVEGVPASQPCSSSFNLSPFRFLPFFLFPPVKKVMAHSCPRQNIKTTGLSEKPLARPPATTQRRVLLPVPAALQFPRVTEELKSLASFRTMILIRCNSAASISPLLRVKKIF